LLISTLYLELKKCSRAKRMIRSKGPFTNGSPMRRFLSFLMASAILLAGLALGVFEIVRAEGIRPYLLVGAGLMIGAASVWLVDEFVRPWRRR
jgi:hypothetical protein